MTEVVPFPHDADNFEVLLVTGLNEHGPYMISAETLGEGKVGDRLVFWNKRGTCIHGKIVSMRPIRAPGT